MWSFSLALFFINEKSHVGTDLYMIALFFKVVENGIVIIFSAFSSYGRVNFCYEMKDHKKALKLCTFDNCSMFSFLLMFFFSESPEPTQLVCASCNAEFSAAWDLCQHAQQEHSLSIYKAVNHCLYFIFK